MISQRSESQPSLGDSREEFFLVHSMGISKNFFPQELQESYEIHHEPLEGC